MTASVQPYVFEDLLAVNPADRTTRLVYADWLEEQGREAEGEFHRWLAGVKPCNFCKFGWRNPYAHPAQDLPPNPLYPFVTKDGEHFLCGHCIAATDFLGSHKLREGSLWPTHPHRRHRTYTPFSPWRLHEAAKRLLGYKHYTVEEIEKELAALGFAYRMAKIIAAWRRLPSGKLQWESAYEKACVHACKILNIPLPPCKKGKP